MEKRYPNIILDFGGVLLDWNPHYLYDPYFGSKEKTDWFIQHVCTPEWNLQMDKGKPFAEGVREKIAECPEWEKEIRLYHSGWIRMIGEEIPGMYELEKDLKAAGYRLLGLTNWSLETFRLVCDRRIFTILDDLVVSGREKMVKPDPAFFRLALARWGVPAESCLFIDDNLANVQGARAVGIDAVQFTDAGALRALLLG
jgi:2-haloacid dehalogenase